MYNLYPVSSKGNILQYYIAVSQPGYWDVGYSQGTEYFHYQGDS